MDRMDEALQMRLGIAHTVDGRRALAMTEREFLIEYGYNAADVDEYLADRIQRRRERRERAELPRGGVLRQWLTQWAR